MILPSQDPIFPTIENLLSWTSKRQQALSSNVANLDTPGYRAKDYSFKSELESFRLTTTSPNHIAIVQDQANVRLFDVGTTERPNGNNVDIERELTEVTKNAMQYVTLVQYLNQKIRTLRSAITDGGKI